MNKSADYKRVFPAALIIVCILVIIIHAFSFYQKKAGYYIDETLSFQLANNKVTSLDKVIEMIRSGFSEESKNEIRNIIIGTNTWKSHDEIMSKYTVSNENRFDYFNTYFLQATDVHPPLYYYLIKTICSLFPNMSLKTVGFLINITALFFSLILVYKISMLVFENNICSIAVLLYYGLSYDFVNNSTYYRMYALLTFWMVYAVYINLQWYRSGYTADRKTIIKLCIANYLAMLTQYFALFFCLPLFAINMILMIRQKMSFRKYLKYSIITGIIYLITWPASIYHLLFSNRGNDVTQKLSGFRVLHNILDYTYSVKKSLFAESNKLFMLVIILIVALIMIKLVTKIRKHELKNWILSERFGILLYVFASAFLYYFIAANATPWFHDRYIMPVMPLFSIIIVYSGVEVSSYIIKNRSICGLLLICLTIAVCFRWHVKNAPLYLYNSPERIEYMQTYSDYDAAIIDGRGNICNCEIELNFSHPRVYETDEENIDTIYNEIGTDESFVFYINKSADCDSISSALAEKGYNITRQDLETDYYRIYTMN